MYISGELLTLKNIKYVYILLNVIHIINKYFSKKILFFFFQAEDGIRDGTVTGVQTCALPIYAGAQALTLHARTRTQMFSGKADWDEIARVVAALDIPVIGNGDLMTPEDIVAMRRHTGCAGAMIARGAFGNPWIFTQGRDLLAGRPKRADPSPEERFATALEHARLALRLQGDNRKTALEFRKHFGWYTKGVAGAASLRERLFQIESMQQAEAIFADYLAGSAVEQ